MQKISRKKLITFAAIAAATIIIFYFSKGCSSKSKYRYEYQKISIGEVIKTISVTGKLEIIDAKRVLSEVAGIVQNVYFDFNDKVKKGQLMIYIDSPDLDKTLIKYRDTIEGIKLSLNAAERRLNASKKMLEENLIPKESVKSAEQSYRSQKVSMKHTMMTFNDLLKQKRATRMRAPVSGTILSRHVEENVNVGNGTLAFIIAPDLKKMRLIISIDEADIGQIKDGQNVTFSVSAFLEKTFIGKITQVRLNPIKSGDLVTYNALVDCSNEELLLKPGMTATASVLVARKEKVKRLLNQAFLVSPKKITYPPGKKFIWVRDKLSRDAVPMNHVEVQTGLGGDMYTEVTSDIPNDAEVLIRIDEKKK